MATLIDTLSHEAWIINGWKIHFVLSEMVIHQISKTTPYPVWYENETTSQVWMQKLGLCFTSLERCYQTFGWLPQIGDRLFDEDLGLMIKDRSIDGTMKTITFTLTL